MGKNFFIYALALNSIISYSQGVNDYSLGLNFIKQDSFNSVSNDETLFKWRHGPGLYLGYVVLADDLGDNFKNFIDFGLSWTFEYKRVIALGVRIDYGVSKTKQDISLDTTTWNHKTRAYFYRGELFLGINIFESRDFKIMPIVGISSISIMSKSLDPNFPYYIEDEKVIFDYEKEKITFEKGATLFGITIDFKIRKQRFKANEFAAIKLNYSYYMSNFEKKYGMFNGNIQSITIGAGGLFGL